MSMSNIKGQIRHAVCCANCMGESRRSEKFSDNDSEWKIFSRGEMTEMRKVATDFGSFMMTNFPEVKKVIDIRGDMLQEWLNSKVDTCAQSTLAKYVCISHKLEAVCSHAYKGVHMESEKLHTPVSTKTGVSVRTVSMGEEQYKLLLEKLKQPGLDSLGRHKPQTEIWKSVQLSHAVGLRTLETTKVHYECVTFSGGRYGYGTITLRPGSIDGAKHGRGRIIDIISPEAQKEVKEVIAGVKQGHTIMEKRDGGSYSTESVYKAINAAMDKINSEANNRGEKPVFDEGWKWNRGNHPLRKDFAQRCYNAAREETQGIISESESRKLAIDYASKQLGHGNNRSSDLKTYVSDQW